jgi:hypothetical protein
MVVASKIAFAAKLKMIANILHVPIVSLCCVIDGPLSQLIYR